MRAIQIPEFGDPRVLTVNDVDRPEPDDDELLVETRAAGYNPMDRLYRTGDLQPGEPLPVTLGGDVAGVVRETGDDVAEFEAGDRVYGTTSRRTLGGYAEYALATPDTVAAKPEALDFARAAAVPTVALTAREGILDVGGVTSDDVVLVHGAAGGVGSFAVQFAARAGATVLATAAETDHEYVRRLGADRVVDYRESFEDQYDDVDVVLDVVGGETRARSWQVLAPDGTLVSIIGEEPDPPGDADRTGELFYVDIDADELATIADLFDDDALDVTAGERFDLADAATVHEVAQSDDAPRGKLVLVPAAH